MEVWWSGRDFDGDYLLIAASVWRETLSSIPSSELEAGFQPTSDMSASPRHSPSSGAAFRHPAMIPSLRKQWDAPPASM